VAAILLLNVDQYNVVQQAASNRIAAFGHEEDFIVFNKKIAGKSHLIYFYFCINRKDDEHFKTVS